MDYFLNKNPFEITTSAFVRDGDREKGYGYWLNTLTF